MTTFSMKEKYRVAEQRHKKKSCQFGFLVCAYKV